MIATCKAYQKKLFYFHSVHCFKNCHPLIYFYKEKNIDFGWQLDEWQVVSHESLRKLPIIYHKMTTATINVNYQSNNVHYAISLIRQRSMSSWEWEEVFLPLGPDSEQSKFSICFLAYHTFIFKSFKCDYILCGVIWKVSELSIIKEQMRNFFVQ